MPKSLKAKEIKTPSGEVKITKTIDKFYGTLTRENINDMNSGLAKFETTFGSDPFSNPSNLTWFEQPSSILTLGVTDGPLVNLRTHLSSQDESAYGVTTETGKLYQIQVNSSASIVSSADKASVISQFVMQAPTFRYGSDIQFFGPSSVVGLTSVDKMYIGSDNGMNKVYSDGSFPSFVGAVGSYTQNIPRPVVQFVGSLFFGNGNNIGQIDATETVISYAKLSPGLPTGLYIRDLDVTPDGNYMLITASRLNQVGQAVSNTEDVTRQTSVDSYKFLWNGSDATVTSYETYNGVAFTSSTSFADKNYSTGYDMRGMSLYDSATKEFTLPNVNAPNFSAMVPAGNMLTIGTTMYDTTSNTLKGEVYFYGQYDKEVPKGLYRPLRYASGQGTDVEFLPACIPVSNLFRVPSFYGYANNIAGDAKLYLSSSEAKNSGSLTVYYPVYKFSTVPTGRNSVLAGVYETQNEIFSKKIKPTEIRFYTEPLVAGNSFQIDLIGSSGGSIAGSRGTFTVGSVINANTSVLSATAGQDYVWYNPATAPQHNLGVRITNLGDKNWTGIKMELDLVEQGK